jgi:Zn-dependent protease with chaperone function
MAFLVMVFLLLVCLFEDYWRPLWGGPPELAATLTSLAVLFVGAHALAVSRRLTHSLRRAPDEREHWARRYEKGRFVHQFVLLIAYVVALVPFGWGWAVKESWPRGWPGLEVLRLAPFFLAQVLSWLIFYDADRALHETSPCGDRSPFSRRWPYAVFQVRQKMALVFLPVALMIGQKELFRLLPREWQEWQGGNLLGIAALLVVFLAMPFLVRLVLGLEKMPPGPLRDRLEAAARRLNFRSSGILLWNTRGGVANAMVVGVLPFARYVVFTDRLLAEMAPEEVEAVFGHEVGHVKHHHMLYYLLFLSASITVLAIAGNEYLLPAAEQGVALVSPVEPEAVAAPEATGESASPTSSLMLFPAFAVMVSYIFVVFGFLSRRCERQADVYGCRTGSCASPGCTGHGPEEALVPRAQGLCPTGIRTFIQALEKVAVLNGIDRERPGFLSSWQHSTIARRVAFLQRMLDDPKVEPAFQRRVALIKWALFAALGLVLAFLVWRSPHALLM